MLSEFYLNGIKQLFDERSILYYVLEAFVLSNDNNFACVICASYQIAKVFERTSSDVWYTLYFKDGNANPELLYSISIPVD